MRWCAILGCVVALTLGCGPDGPDGPETPAPNGPAEGGGGPVAPTGAGDGDPAPMGDAGGTPGDGGTGGGETPAGGGTDDGAGGGTPGGGTGSGGGNDGGGGNSGAGGGDSGGSSGNGNGGGSGGGSSGNGNGGGSGGNSGNGGGVGGGGGGTPGSTDGTSVVIARVDAHPECDGLVPASAKHPVVREVAPASQAAGCGEAVSEGGGHVAIAMQGTGPREWQVFSPGGEVERRIAVSSRLLPQPDGWIGAQAPVRPPYGTVHLLAFAADGAPRRTDDHSEGEGYEMHDWGLAEDPAGGALLVHASRTTDGTSRCRSELIRYDATGEHLSTAEDVACTHPAFGVSTRGEALVVGDAGGPSASWLDREGRVVLGPTPLPPRAEGYGRALSPLLDGSLVSRPVHFERLATSPSPAPAWLAERPGATFRFTRGNRGYAVFPPAYAESSDCSVAIELLAPSGRRCGTVTLRSSGGACTSGFVDQGWDGTVVQKVRADQCTYRWWPRLLAGD